MLFIDKHRLQTPADIRDAYEVRICSSSIAPSHQRIEATAEFCPSFDERSLLKEMKRRGRTARYTRYEVTQEIKDLLPNGPKACNEANALVARMMTNHCFRVEIMISIGSFNVSDR
jgi:hypothetical protein